MATLTWRCEAKPRFLQTHLGDKQGVAVNFIARCDGSTLGCFSFRAQSAGATAVRCC